MKGDRKWRRLEELKDPVGIVTGGSSGLGSALVTELLTRYPNLVVVNVDKIPPKIKDKRLLYHDCDLSNSADTAMLLQSLKRAYGKRISLIINNAGIRLPYGDIKSVKESEMRKIFDVNTFAPVSFLQELVPDGNDTSQQCYVVTIASTLGILAPARVSAYAASKAALMAFHLSLSAELVAKRIDHVRTLLVLPGQLNTEMFSGFEPPRQFFAPVVNVSNLARDIIDRCEKGKRGCLEVPFYSHFAHLLMSMPYSLQLIVRKFAKMDECLPDE